MQNKTGGAAFPRATGEAKISNTEAVYNYAQAGMTLRQYYKAKVAAGLVSAKGKRWSEDFCDEPVALDEISKFISALADALLVEDAEFGKQQGGGE